MAEFVNRAVREKLYVPGTGGSMEIVQFMPPTSPPTAKVVDGSTRSFVDVTQWGLVIDYLFDDATGSGAVGGDELVRVGMSWVFAATIKASYGQFVDVAMGSARGVNMIFNLGDPQWWAAKGLPAFSYRGEAMLTQNKPVSVSKKNVTLDITGRGSGGGVLWGYLDEVPIASGLWP